MSGLVVLLIYLAGAALLVYTFSQAIEHPDILLKIVALLALFAIVDGVLRVGYRLITGKKMP